MKSQQVILAATPLCRLVDARSSMIQATRHSDLAVAFNRQGKARVNRVDAGLATRLELGHYCIETAFPQHAPCSHPPDRARVFAGKRQGRGVRTAPKDRDWPGMHGGKRWKFKKSVDGRALVVVAEIRNNDCWLLTAYYEG